MERSDYRRLATAVSLDQWLRYVTFEDTSWNSRTSAYGHLTSMVTWALWLSPKRFPMIKHSPTNTMTTLFRTGIVTNPVQNGRITPIKQSVMAEQPWFVRSQTGWLATLTVTTGSEQQEANYCACLRQRLMKQQSSNPSNSLISNH